MLGWMLKRGENAPPTDIDGADTTQIDEPDTPAPVFAARAFKSALFGPDAARGNEPQAKNVKSQKVQDAYVDDVAGTPSRPQGILLTPGTGTSRRKRVSFGHHIDAKRSKKSEENALGGGKEGARKRTQLTEALEKSRTNPTTKHVREKGGDRNEHSSDEWEEADEDDYCIHDITVDLDEPCSQSGKYWKDECQKYRAEAKIEMDKLLRYRQMAKSFARQKDAEAVELAEKLRDEQQKVLKMEKKIANNASQIASRSQGVPQESDDLIAKLSRQTVMAAQYRQQVQQLEDQLENLGNTQEADASSRRRRQLASPRTQKTITETQRELRKARAQVKELGELREQVTSLKAQLRASEKGTAKESGQPESSRAQDLRAQLRQAKEESKLKDEELYQLRKEFETYRQESDTHAKDTNAVLERAHAKVSELKKEIKGLKAAGPSDNARLESLPAPSHKLPRTRARRHIGIDDTNDLRRVSEPEQSLANGREPLSLREQYEDADAIKALGQTRAASVRDTALTDRPNLEKPKWQPFVPRPPRDRAYLGDDIARRIEHGGTTPAPKSSKNSKAVDMQALSKVTSHNRNEEGEDEDGVGVDLLQDRFARLGGPDTTRPRRRLSQSNKTKSKLPAERRAAALARIEARMAEKKRSKRSSEGHNKENVRPLMA